jgi:tetratricopeptide (TPR) repeat protein
MKIRSLVFGLLITAAICRLPHHSLAGAAETNAEPSVAVAIPVPAQPGVTVSDLEELRLKLDAIQRANDLTFGRWSAVMEQNSALSNVLAGLQETLVAQRKRESELSEQARAQNTHVLLGAGAAVFLVFLASYWFQLRCMNRVMELTRAEPAALPAPIPMALLESQSARESKLLEAIKLLESRVQQLEGPGSAGNGTAGENGHAKAEATKLIENAAAPMEAPSSTSGKVSLLLAKGEILLDMERYQESLIALQEAVALDPANAEAHLKKGIALERMNRLELSLAAYDESLRLNPKRSFAYVHKARVLSALHRYDEALSVYDQALGKGLGKPGAAVGNGSRAAHS